MVEDFFSNLEMPSLDELDKSELERHITDITEMNNAIKKMKPGKAPGPDGFPIEFFKTFGPKLLAYLVKVFEEVLGK